MRARLWCMWLCLQYGTLSTLELLMCENAPFDAETLLTLPFCLTCLFTWNETVKEQMIITKY